MSINQSIFKATVINIFLCINSARTVFRDVARLSFLYSTHARFSINILTHNNTLTYLSRAYSCIRHPAVLDTCFIFWENSYRKNHLVASDGRRHGTTLICALV